MHLSKDRLKAEHWGEDETRQWTLFDSATNFIRVKVVVNPQHFDLCIGFVTYDALNGIRNLMQKSWCIATGNHALFARGQVKSSKNFHIKEGSVVFIKKSAENCLTFKVDNVVVYNDWNTGLDAEEFGELVGCVNFLNNGDKVEIIPVDGAQ